MTNVEYTEQAVKQLEKLDPQVADRVLNKVEEATEWTDHRLEPLPVIRTTNSALVTAV